MSGIVERAQHPLPRRRVLQWALATGGALSAMPVLAACGGDGAGETGGTVTVGTAVDIINFDPYQQTTNALLVLRLLNSWLLTYDEELEPVPDALESYEISDDRVTCRLVLRKDVTFVTGKTMAAEDVVYAFERAMDPETGGNLAGPSAILKGVEADGEDVVLTFQQPTNTSLIEDLLVGQPVLDKDANNDESLAKGPGSAGPYTVKEWRPGESLTLTAVPDWYGGEIANDEVEIRVYTDTNAQVSALASKAIDIAVYVPPRDAARLKDQMEYLDSYPGAATMLLRVSAANAPFDDKSVRQAMQHAINRQRIVDEVLYGFGGPALLPWGPKSPAQDPAYDDDLSYDLDKAKKLLSESGAKSGKALVNGSDPVSIAVMQIIQADLKTIGFDLQIDQIDAATFQDRLVAGDFGVVLGQMGGGQLSLPRIVQNSLFRLSNNPLWKDGKPPADYVEAIRALTTEEEEAAVAKAYTLLNDTIVDQAWSIGAYYVPQIFMYSSEVTGVARDHQNSLVLTETSA